MFRSCPKSFRWCLNNALLLASVSRATLRQLLPFSVARKGIGSLTKGSAAMAASASVVRAAYSQSAAFSSFRSGAACKLWSDYKAMAQVGGDFAVLILQGRA